MMDLLVSGLQHPSLRGAVHLQNSPPEQAATCDRDALGPSIEWLRD